MLPRFDGSDIETYLLNFVRTATLNEWTVNHWTTLLNTQITGKVQKLFTELTLEDSTDYNVVKEHLLIAFEVVPEVYQKRFKSLHKDNAKTYSSFAYKLRTETLILEQFNETIQPAYWSKPETTK